MKDMYDPMTGELLQQPEEEINFDPMTGQPINRGSAQPEGEMNFDPMTGQPIYNGTSSPVPEKKGKKLPIIAGVIGGIIVVAAIIIVCVINGVFLSKPNKVLLAAKNTLNGRPQFVEDFGLDEASDMIRSGKYQLDVKVNADDVSVEGAYISTNAEKQLNLDVSPSGGPSVEVKSSLSDSKLKVYVPIISRDVYTLNYREEADGYLADILEDSGVKYEDLTQILEAVYEPKEVERHTEELSNALLKQFRELDWRNEEKEEFKINGKSRKAKGYGVTFTADDAEDFLDIIEDYLSDNYEGMDTRDLMNDLNDELRDMPDIDCIFYVYKNQLAAICMEDEDDVECEILFKGGDFRMQNMEFRIDDRDDSVSIELEGKTSGDKESYELLGDGHTLFALEYNTKSGDYEVELDTGYDRETIEGTIRKERGKVGASIEYGNDFEAEFSLTKDASLEVLPDREVDVMDMDKEDWWNLIGNADFF